MNKKIKMTLFAGFFFTAGLIVAFSCNNMVYGDMLGPDVEISGTATLLFRLFEIFPCPERYLFVVK